MKGTVLTLLCAITIAQGQEFFLGNRKLCICNPSDAHAICANWDLEDIVIAHERCDKFYKCAYGKPVPYCCPRGTVFNIDIKDCDWPANVQCGDRGFVPDDENECLKSNEGNDDGGNEDLGPCNCDPSEAPSICKAPGSEGVLVAHEYCNHFYICNHGKPVAMKCGPHTLYNPYTQKCTWSHEVECGDRIIPKDEENDVSNENDDGEEGGGIQGPCNCDPAKAPEICAAEGSDGILVAHEYCHKYYICNHGKPFPNTCPPHTLYNPYIERCDWPRNVDCGDRICICDDGSSDCDGGSNDEDGPIDSPSGEGNGSCNCDPSEAPKICAQEGSDGVLVAHEYCNKFYKCYSGKPVAMLCPPDLLYNPHTEQCDWPQNVDCGDRVIPDDKDEDDSNNDGGEDGPNDGGEDNGSCNCDPSEAPNICAQEGSDGVLVAHEYCNKFYKCYSGKPVAMLCPPDLLYNPHTEQCDWPQNVDCGDRVIPDDKDEDDSNNDGGEDGPNDGGEDNGSCNCDPSEAPNICAQEGSDGVLVAHEYCNKFYKCYRGKPVAMLCPPDLLYNPHTEQCDWPQNVDCGDRVIPDDKDEDDSNNDGGEDGPVDGGEDNGSCNCDPSEAPNICAKEGSDGVLVAHEYCNQFYKCYRGKPVAMLCPPDLLYNPHTEQCDWPQNVDCGDRIIPDSNEDNDDCQEDSSIDPELCAAPGSNGLLFPHRRCDRFYMCSGGQAIVVSCPWNMPLFNPVIGACDEAANVDCGDRIVPDPDEDPCPCFTSMPAICTTPGSHGMQVPHEKCNQFYTCIHGSAVTRSCPQGLFYEPKRQVCDWPMFVSCEGRIMTPSKKL